MKNIVKRMAALLISIMLVLSITGCSGNKPKDFTVEEMTFTLTNSFVESANETQTAVFVTQDYVVTVLRQDFEEFETLGMPTDMDVATYTSMMLQENNIDAEIELYDSEVEDYSFVIGFTYDQVIEDNTVTYFATVYRSDKAYWFIQYAAPENNSEGFEEAKPQFIEWSKTVRFEGSDSAEADSSEVAE